MTQVHSYNTSHSGGIALFGINSFDEEEHSAGVGFYCLWLTRIRRLPAAHQVMPACSLTGFLFANEVM